MTTLGDITDTQQRVMERQFHYGILANFLESELESLPRPGWDALRVAFKHVRDYLKVTAGMTEAEHNVYITAMILPEDRKPDGASVYADLITETLGANVRSALKGN